MTTTYLNDNEPTLPDILNDPIVKILMKYDGVSEQDIKPMLGESSAQVYEAA